MGASSWRWTAASALVALGPGIFLYKVDTITTLQLVYSFGS